MIYSSGKFKVCHDIESFLEKVRFKNSVRFLGITLDETLGWKSHVDFVVKKWAQRLYILRRLRSVTTNAEFFRSIVELYDLYWNTPALLLSACPLLIPQDSNVFNSN